MMGKLRVLFLLLVLLFLAAGCAPQIALEWVTRTPAPAPDALPATPDLSVAVQTAVVPKPTVLVPAATPGHTQAATATVVSSPTRRPTDTPAEIQAATSTVAPTVTRGPANTPLPPSAWPTPVKELVNQAGRWQVFTSANQVNDLAVQGGILWAATEGGLVRWDIEKCTYAKYTTLDGLPRNSVNAVEVGSDGALWLGTSDGLIRWDGRQWSSFQEQVPGDVHDIAVGQDGTLWIASGYTRVTCYDGEYWTDSEQKDGLAHGRPVAIAMGPSGSVWVGHESGSLSRWDGQTWITVTVPIINPLVDVAVDAQGMVWVGSQGDGIRRWDGKAWTHMPKPTAWQTTSCMPLTWPPTEACGSAQVVASADGTAAGG